MEINTLKAFLAVAEMASFSMASERLYITQPAVSKRIAVLEGELGSPLFDRIGRRVSLTETGRQLLPRARALLLEIEDIKRNIVNQTEKVAGRLTMATSHHIGLHRLPPLLREFSRRYPEVRLDIRFMDSERACIAVEQGTLELAVVTLPPTPSKSVVTQQIWHDPLHFVVSHDHPLAGQEKCGLEALCRHPAVLASKGTYTREILEQALAPFDLHILIGMATNYLETLKMMVSIGLGWSLLPETMIRKSDLEIVPIRQIKLSRELGGVTHQTRTLSNAARAMLELCQNHADSVSMKVAKPRL